MLSGGPLSLFGNKNASMRVSKYSTIIRSMHKSNAIVSNQLISSHQLSWDALKANLDISSVGSQLVTAMLKVPTSSASPLIARGWESYPIYTWECSIPYLSCKTNNSYGNSWH